MKYKTQLIKPARPEDDQERYPEGITKDIIETVLYADSKNGYYTKEFAATLKGKTLIDTCRNVWEFVKTQIPYVLDPVGEQLIKSPGRLWQLKAGDCKSFSVFTASCLKNVGIPYGYRFTSYSKTDPTPTHVYVYVPMGKTEIILDSVWTGPFNTQKQYTFKEDKLMSRIAYLGATSAAKHVPGEFKLTKPIDQMSDSEMTLLLARQRLEIDKANSAAMGGPFNWQIARYDQAIGVVNAALGKIDNPDEIIRMGEHFTRQAIQNGKPAHVGSFFKKIGKGLKKVVKAVTKVATLPMRLIAKGILEIYLPKAAPMFLYLFADEKALPDKMRAKRKKAQKFKDFIVKKIGMKDAHFMGLVRNSLTKKFKMSPESYLAKAIKNIAVKGIGDIGKAKKKVNKQKKKKSRAVNVETQSSSSLRSGGGATIFDNVAEGARQAAQDNGGADDSADDSAPAKRSKSAGGALVDVGSKAATGNYIGAIISAISWIISKLGGKKAGISISQEDVPDLEADSGNAISEESRNTNFKNVPDDQMDRVKEVTTGMIYSNATPMQVQRTVDEQLNFLSPAEKQSVQQEVQSGFDPLTTEEADQAYSQIKKPAPGAGGCNC